MALRVDDVDLVRDRALVERFQEGDGGAFDTLYRRYFPRLTRFCQKRVGDRHEAEEIAQEAFARALRALPTFEGERRFYPWLTVIAGRLCVDAHRRRGRTEPSDSVDLGVIDGGQEKVVDAADLAVLAQALGRLAPRHREVLDLREHQERSYQQIADHYGVTVGTVEALLFRARKALRREFMAVVGGDRNWAAVPGLGLVLRKLGGLRARVDAATSAVPALASPVFAVALAVTTMSVAVGGVFEATRMAAAPPVASAVRVVPTPANPLVDGAAQTDAAPSALPLAGTPDPDVAGDQPGNVSAVAAPRVDTPAADSVGAQQANDNTADDPVRREVLGVFLGADPALAAEQVSERVTGYQAGLGL